MSAITAKASRKMKKYAVLTREPRCFLGSFDFSWEQRKFSELVQIERGGSPRPIDDFITDAPNGLNWVKIGDAPTQGNYITKTAEKIRPEGLSKTREVHPGDLILSNSMSFGKPYIMGIDGCIHDGWLLIRNMLSHPKDTHWYPVFYVMANTGMRVGEITGLRWSDIDLKKGIIRVNHTLVYYNHRDEKGCYFSINTPKTKAGEREIPMTEGVKQAFLMEREFQSQAEISSKSRVDGYDDFIFVNRYGDVQNQGNLNKALRRMMRDCNDEILEKYGSDSDPVLLPQFSCHILRHTFATRLCESGANLKFIQSILGHADVSTTMNIYVDVTDALKKKEITAFDDYMTTKLET